MSGPLPFPRPRFPPEQSLADAFDFTSMISEHVNEITRRETEAVQALLAIAEADETKPGITVRSEFKGLTQDTYVFEQTVEFDEKVQRGMVHYAPLPTGWLDEL